MGNATVVSTVAIGLVFDFTNGLHDTANAIATTIATRALPPREAVGLAAILNFLSAFISIAVAATIARHRRAGRGDRADHLLGLVGAIL